MVLVVNLRALTLAVVTAMAAEESRQGACRSRRCACRTLALPCRGGGACACALRGQRIVAPKSRAEGE